MITARKESLPAGDITLLERLAAGCDAIREASRITGDFASMLRERKGSLYPQWRNRVANAAIPEMTAFAESLDKDLQAVVNGLTLPWSNGPTEAHVNRLKAVKRQMYGRAGFEMLRKSLLMPP